MAKLSLIVKYKVVLIKERISKSLAATLFQWEKLLTEILLGK